MEKKEKIELLKNYFNCLELLNDNFIHYDYDHNIMGHYFMFSDIIYSSQIKYIVSLNLDFYLISIDKNIYLAIRN